MKRVVCRGPNCGREIVWAKDESGKRIPLDPSSPVFEVVDEEADPPVIKRAAKAFVSHFRTCPDADRFSSRAKGALLARECPVENCQERIAADRLMCGGCWQRVPKELQANVLELLKRARRSPEHLEACNAAIRAAGAAA